MSLVYVNGRGQSESLQGTSWDLRLSEGIDGSGEARGEDQVLPFRNGRIATGRYMDSRPLTLEGAVVSGPAGYRAALDTLLRLFDPTAGVGRLVATLDDGSTRFILCRSKGLLAGPLTTTGYRRVGVELEAPDPFWYANLGVNLLGSAGPRYLGQGYTLGDSEDLGDYADLNAARRQPRQPVAAAGGPGSHLVRRAVYL